MNRKASYYMERSAAIIAAIILLQTLFFKFTAHPDSVYIFSTIGGEPYTRITLGILKLIISFLLVLSRTSIYGALLGAITMLGAIGSHLLLLGIEVNGDKGKLFILAVITFLCCWYIIYIKWKQLIKHLKSQR